jgi:hypothetical protein
MYKYVTMSPSQANTNYIITSKFIVYIHVYNSCINLLQIESTQNCIYLT